MMEFQQICLQIIEAEIRVHLMLMRITIFVQSARTVFVKNDLTKILCTEIYATKARAITLLTKFFTKQ